MSLLTCRGYLRGYLNKKGVMASAVTPCFIWRPLGDDYYNWEIVHNISRLHSVVV